MSAPTFTERVERLIGQAANLGVRLAEDAASLTLRYLDAMLAENERINLTAIRTVDAATVLHALDSLALARAVGDAPARALDLGTGNGFPGVAIAALWPSCRVVLCDRTQKKVAAVSRALAAADRSGVEAVAIDVAQAAALRPDWRGAFDLVTVRAVGTPRAVATLAAPLLRTGGALVLWLDAGTQGDALPGYGAGAVVDYDLPEPTPRRRRLATYRRIRS